MGLIDKYREHSQDKRHQDWAREVAPVREMAEMAHRWTGEPISADAGIIGRRGELAYLLLQGAALIEPRRLPGQWSGRSQGFSIPIYKGIRYRVGASRGNFQQGAEVPTPIDTGTVLISDQRVVFAGSKQTREWLYPKLIGFHHDAQAPWTALQVSNRQKVSGILYTAESAVVVRFRLELALAQYSGSREVFAASIDQQLAQLMASEPKPAPVTRPAPIARPATPSNFVLPAAGWYPNPEGPGRRYWDGARWTDKTAP